MSFTFTLMNEAAALEIMAWHYEAPYTIYNSENDDEFNVEGMLDPRTPYYAASNEQHEIIGYFCFGTSAIPWNNPPGLYMPGDPALAIGLGLRPDQTGKGHGLAYVEAGLDFARQTFQPASFLLYVFPWNERAIRVYERVGFQRVRVLPVSNDFGEVEFLEMRRQA